MYEEEGEEGGEEESATWLGTGIGSLGPSEVSGDGDDGDAEAVPVGVWTGSVEGREGLVCCWGEVTPPVEAFLPAPPADGVVYGEGLTVRGGE